MDEKTKPEKVPITKLKANLALYIGRMKAGESFLVTDHGSAIAILEPLGWEPEADEDFTALVLAGLMSPPSSKLDDAFFQGPRVKDPASTLRARLDSGKEEHE